MVNIWTVAMVTACLACVAADWGDRHKSSPPSWRNWGRGHTPPSWSNRGRNQHTTPDLAKWREKHFPSKPTPPTRYRDDPTGQRSASSDGSAALIFGWIGGFVMLMIGTVCCISFCMCMSKRRGANSSIQNGQSTLALAHVNVIPNTVPSAPSFVTTEAIHQPERDASSASTDPPPYSEVGLHPKTLPPPYPG